MFIHWGLYAQKFSGADAEWSMLNAKIPVATYKALAGTFNPTNFDADAWVTLAKNAGIKYMVFTTKHHDGFAMYDSKVDPFNIIGATPFHRDPLKELTAACNRQGMKLGFYYSQDQDWTAPGGAAHGGDWDPAQKGSFADYLDKKAIPQIQELLTNYQPCPALIWFDYPTADMTPELASKIVPILNQYPNLIWNDRLGGGYLGDAETHEGNIPPQGYPGRDWETCMTMNGHWGFTPKDHNFKSAETLLRNLIDIASKGGNYLLNVGPDASGVIPQQEADRLMEMGKWLAVNGEAIYGTEATPFAEPHGSYDSATLDHRGKPTWVPTWDWRCTTKPGKIYVHIFQWPGKTFTLSGVKSVVTGAYLLADRGTPLKFLQNGESLIVTLPPHAPDQIASVLVLEVNGSNAANGKLSRLSSPSPLPGG
jgi:alpha-L-fucosidase